MTGNCLKGSRPIVVFDKAFDESPHFMVIKEVLSNVSVVDSGTLWRRGLISMFTFPSCLP